MSQEKKVSFKDTLNLPQTDFPIRAKAQENDPKMLKRWAQSDMSAKVGEHNKGKKTFILHDGPPYANGNIHLGHAYNKILKDIVAKSQRMQGKHAPITPGWDCHGLPIELKVSQDNPHTSPQDLKKKCRAYAQKWIDTQRDEFKKLGVFMDWDNPYLTMNFEYESSILKAFGQFVADGYIERKNKTVPWCASCKTVLASAEIEYQERKDPSIYVQFPLADNVAEKMSTDLAGKEVSLLVWTTTPWTLPLNRAVLLKPNSDYVVLDVNGTYVIVGAALADKICAMLAVDKNVVAQFNSQQLVDLSARAQHPFIENFTVPILLDQSVLTEDGTACVHSAPGCGPEDYEVGVRNKLEIFSPLSPDGKYTQGIAPQELEGMPIADGQIWVLRKLKEVDRLLHKTSLRHSYPHCWRCRNGLMFRATKQWFCDLSQGNLKQRVLEKADSIKTIPVKSINRLKATVEGRLEWCLSRQRVWGVPIPALLCTDCDTTHISQELVNTVADNVVQQGVEYWDTVAVEELAKSITCSSCNGTNFKKEQDILDVWFDSGVSHYAVLQKQNQFPADMYLEGKDQHRGWFQSSLLTSMVLEDTPAMKTIMTHGFTVDEKGRKMSKSLGNVVKPDEIIEKLGTDGLRLWASIVDCGSEAVVSDVLLKNVQQVLRKIRNTARFLLSNLYDFDINKDAIDFNELLVIDKYALQQLHALNTKVIGLYNEYNFTAIAHALADYCAVDLSSFYLDIVKDRLYVEQADGLARRSTQTACWYILDTLTKLIAPILSFTAEQIADNYHNKQFESIHLQNFNILAELANLAEAHDEQQWTLLKNMRSAFLKAIELQREQGLIKHPLEVNMQVFMDPTSEHIETLQQFKKQLEPTGQTIDAFFKEVLIVSYFEHAASKDGLTETELPGLYACVTVAQGDKCPRCWHWSQTDHEHKLCERCQKVVRYNNE